MPDFLKKQLDVNMKMKFPRKVNMKAAISSLIQFIERPMLSFVQVSLKFMKKYLSRVTSKLKIVKVTHNRWKILSAKSA
jgi:hypothetical protein